MSDAAPGPKLMSAQYAAKARPTTSTMTATILAASLKIYLLQRSNRSS